MIHLFIIHAIVHWVAQEMRPLSKEERFLAVSSVLIFGTIAGLVSFLVVRQTKCYRRRYSLVHRFDSARDLLLDLEEGERGQLSGDDGVVQEATIDALFPNILEQNSRERDSSPSLLARFLDDGRIVDDDNESSL